jgi:hypothetical protein
LRKSIGGVPEGVSGIGFAKENVEKENNFGWGV